MTLAGDGRHMLVTNAASGDVTVFVVSVDGSLDLVGRTPVGPRPTSVVFRVRPDGSLEPAQVVASSGPTSYGFAFGGRGTLVVTEAFGAQKGAAAASSYRVDGTVVTPVTKVSGQRPQRDLLGGGDSVHASSRRWTETA